MKTWLVIPVVGAVVALTASALAPSGGSRGGTVIRLYENSAAIHFTPVDVPPKARQGSVSAGDMFMITGSVFDASARTRKAGELFGQVTAVRAAKDFFHGTYFVHSFYRLAKGSIVVEGVFSEGKTATAGTFAVTGGTGAYAGVRGTFESKEQPNGNEVDTIRLLN